MKRIVHNIKKIFSKKLKVIKTGCGNHQHVPVFNWKITFPSISACKIKGSEVLGFTGSH